MCMCVGTPLLYVFIYLLITVNFISMHGVYMCLIYMYLHISLWLFKCFVICCCYCFLYNKYLI